MSGQYLNNIQLSNTQPQIKVFTSRENYKNIQQESAQYADNF